MLLILVVWAGIYLPELGSLELRGEEGRRVLPAITMQETGNWLVPYVGGRPYLRKPPGVNWAVAASFRIFGRSELAARLPSAVAILILAGLMVWGLEPWLGEAAGCFAGVAFLSTLEVADKGRLIEIDALYVAAFGLALVLWLRWWGRNRWLAWILPGIPLGAGLLLKGPLHLFFFYAIVGCVLWKAQRRKELYSPPLLLGLGVALLVAAAWAVPHLHSPEAREAAKTWSTQFAERLDFSDFHWKDWLLNFPRALLNFFPWILFCGWPQRPAFDDPRFQGLRLGTAFTFLAVMFAPGALPRYTLPLAVPICILAAHRVKSSEANLRYWKVGVEMFGRLLLAVLVAGAFLEANKAYLIPAGIILLYLQVWFQFENEYSVRKLTAASGVTGVAALLLFCGILVPRLQRHEILRPRAAALDARVPAQERIYAVDPGSDQVFYYLKRHWSYLTRWQDLPPEASYLLVPEQKIKEFEQRFPEHQPPLYSYRDKGGKYSALFFVTPRRKG